MLNKCARNFRRGVTWLIGLPLACAALPSIGQAAPVATQATTIPSIVAAHAAIQVDLPAPDEMMHLVVSLPLRNVVALDALLADIYDPDSPDYRGYLSVAQFTERFGPSEEDYEMAREFFAGSGFSVGPRAANRYLIDLEGKVSVIESVFHVNMALYRHPTENRSFISADRPPSIDLPTAIQEVVGLDDFERPYNKLAHGNVELAAGGSGPGGQLTGSDIRMAYYPTGSLTGSGQSIGLMELKGVDLADVSLFFNRGYGAANSVSIALLKTDNAPVTCTGGCDDSEQALDIEYAISMAPGLSSVRVYVGSSPEDVLNAMATDNLSKVLSTSWGWHERFATDDALFKEFSAQGQTNLTASGDYSSLSASGPWPEEDRNIVAVGGTDLQTATPGGLWSQETGWNGSAGGPSLDKTILIEPYQAPFVTSENGGSSKVRNVPDVAASANTDMEICSDGGCSGRNGGTSFASPIWAGFIALANEAAVGQGKPVVGFINPAIYKIGGEPNYTQWLHDIVTGKSGKFNCESSYDLVTGLGSPHGQQLINALIKSIPHIAQ